MMNKLGLIIVSVILALIQTGCAEQSTWMSLNSSNPRIIWEVKPQADLENITGEQISTPESDGLEIAISNHNHLE